VVLVEPAPPLQAEIKSKGNIAKKLWTHFDRFIIKSPSDV